MDTGTNKNNLDWLNPDALVEFIDELRESGYKIGISQYIAAHDLILMLIAQGETLDSPEHLSNLLGPIFCSSPIEQEEFRERFNRWVELYSQINFSKEEIAVEAEALSNELETINPASYRMQRLIFLILISILLSFIFNILSPSSVEKGYFREPRPTGETTTPVLPPVPTETLPEVPAIGKIAPTELPTTLSLDWRILLFYLTVSVAFILWRPWWRANRFLQRYSTTQQPELYKISITGFEDKLVSKIALLKVAQSLRYRIRVPSRELDVNKTINATLSRGGWLTPVYCTYQILPEYLFLVNRASYRDHQAKFVEEIIERLKDEGVFISIYFFDDDPRMCFPHAPDDSPLRLREITSKYSQHSLVIISNTENFFSSISGELEPWVNQLTSWDNRAVLTPTPAENWDHQELEIAQQFIILPATIKGLQVLSQRLRQGVATYSLAEEMRIPLPDSLRIEPYVWIERNPPPSQQINVMLESLEKYLGKDSFYWLSACAIFPELHWNITIYLGNILKSESGKSLIEVCSLTDLARLPWLRYGYIPDWLRIYLITTLTKEQQQIIRTALQDLLNTAVQGSTSKLQLEIARQANNPLFKLTNSIRSLLSKRVSKDSLLRDYIFLGFMTRQSVLTMKVSDEFSRSLQRQKKHCWWLKVLQKLGIVVKPPIYQPSFASSDNSTSLLIEGRKFLRWLVLEKVIPLLLLSLVLSLLTSKNILNIYTGIELYYKYINLPKKEFFYSQVGTWDDINKEIVASKELAKLKLNSATYDPRTAFNRLIKGEIDFVQSISPPSSDQSKEAKEIEVKLKTVSVGYYLIAIAVNQELNLQSITFSELKKIYTGEITNWKQLGGPDLKITPYKLRDKHPNTIFFKDSVLSGRNFSEGVVTVDTNTEALQKLKQKDLGGIYFGSASEIVDECLINTLSVSYTKQEKPISAYQEDGTYNNQCSRKTRKQSLNGIRDNYAFKRQIFVIYREDNKNNTIGDFYTSWLLSEKGQKLIKNASFIPIK